MAVLFFLHQRLNPSFVNCRLAQSSLSDTVRFLSVRMSRLPLSDSLLRWGYSDCTYAFINMFNYYFDCDKMRCTVPRLHPICSAIARIGSPDFRKDHIFSCCSAENTGFRPACFRFCSVICSLIIDNGTGSMLEPVVVQAFKRPISAVFSSSLSCSLWFSFSSVLL